MPDLVFKAARVLDGNAEVIRDVALRGDRIDDVAASIGTPARSEIDCAGLWLLPGAIDMHVHLRDPGMPHKEDIASGTAAAVAAGVTTVADMPNTRPPTLTAEAFMAKLDRARRVARCNVLFYMGLGADNEDEIAAVVGHPAFAGVKVFLGATTGDLLSGEAALVRALDRIDAPFVFHAERESLLRAAKDAFEGVPTAADHHRLRPAAAAVDGARFVASLAAPGRRLHICHLSCGDELPFLDAARGITGEVAPHHLWFTADDTAALGNRLKVNPPVREAADRSALRAALADGRIAAVATDHAPHTADEKALPYPEAPSGTPGIDTMVASTLALVRDGVLTMARAVDAMSGAPARLLRLGTKGRIAPGCDADLFLWDPAAAWTPAATDLGTRCGWSPFEGMTLAARPKAVWLAGRRVV
jgi:dihydroorotase